MTHPSSWCEILPSGFPIHSQVSTCAAEKEETVNNNWFAIWEYTNHGLTLISSLKTIQYTESYTCCTCWHHQYKHTDLKFVTNLCTFPVALVGFTQALSGLPAAGGGVKSCHHLTCPITQPPLYTVCIVQLLNLEKQIIQRVSTEEKTERYHQFTSVFCLCYFKKKPLNYFQLLYNN